MFVTTHPRLYTDAAGIETLRRRLATDAALAARFAAWRTEADKLLDEEFFTEEYADSVKNQHGRYYELGRQLMAMGEKLGLLYALTGEGKYADKIRAAMAHYATFTRWTGPTNQFRDPPWHGELATTQLLIGYAFGYDFCYDALSPAERQAAEQAMVEKGIRPLLTDWVLPGTRVHALDSMGHNWWSVCIALAGIGLLAIHERVAETAEWMPLILEALNGFATYAGEPLFRKCANFDEAGLFYESLNYFNYGVGELLRFGFVYRRCGGDAADVTWPATDKLAEAALPFFYPTGENLLAANFGDSGLTANIRLMATFALLCGNGDRRLVTLRAGGEDGALDFLYPDLLSENGAPVEMADTRAIFPSGYAFVRDSWAPDATLWAVRCGYTWNHAHEDAGHFSLFSRGVPLLTDSGCCPYGEEVYSTYYRRAVAHNVLLMDGAGPAGDPVERGSAVAGTLSHLTHGGGMTYLLADASGPMGHIAERNFRNFLWIGTDVLVIVDDVRLWHPASLDWLLHYEGEGVLSGDELRVQKDGAAASILPLFPHSAEFRAGYREQAWQDTIPYAAFRVESTEPVQALFTVIRLNEAMDEVTVTPVEGEELAGVALTRGDKQWRVWFNKRADGRRAHINANHRLGDWDTDAYLLAEGPDEVLIAGGSYLRQGGKPLFESFVKAFTVVEK